MSDWVGMYIFGADEQSGVELVNLTPHPVSVITPTGTMTIAASGNVARVNVSEQPTGDTINGVPIKMRVTGGVQGLPAPKPGIFYIVSSMVLSAVIGRSDVIAPDTGKDAVRDDKNQIVSVKSFVRNNA